MWGTGALTSWAGADPTQSHGPAGSLHLLLEGLHQSGQSHPNLVLSQDLLTERAVGWFCAARGGTAQRVPRARTDWLRTQVPTHCRNVATPCPTPRLGFLTSMKQDGVSTSWEWPSSGLSACRLMDAPCGVWPRRFSQHSCRPLVGNLGPRLAPRITISGHSPPLGEYLPMSEDMTQALGKVAVFKGITKSKRFDQVFDFQQNGFSPPTSKHKDQ